MTFILAVLFLALTGLTVVTVLLINERIQRNNLEARNNQLKKQLRSKR